MEYERFIEQGKPYNHKADPEPVKKKKKARRDKVRLGKESLSFKCRSDNVSQST